MDVQVCNKMTVIYYIKSIFIQVL